MNTGDKVFKLLEKMNRQSYKKDLHSFKAKIKNGIVWVECRGYETFMETYIYDEKGNETRKQWCGTTVAAANRLEMFEIDFDSIEI